jgi:hypothetical protein
MYKTPETISSNFALGSNVMESQKQSGYVSIVDIETTRKSSPGDMVMSLENMLS